MKEKPLTVARADFNQQLSTLINKSGLPAFVLVGELKNIVAQLEKIAAQQYQADLSRYQKEQEQENDKDKTD